MRFDDKTVLITGGSSGIGAACAKRFRQLGARLSILDKVPPTASGPAVVTVGDINDPLVRTRAVDATIDRYGSIDILVNNAAVGMYEPVSRSAAENDLYLMTTNVLSGVALTQLVIPHMRAQGAGWIANVSSVGAYVALPWSATYCATKSAFHSYSESLRRELRSAGIHVSTIVPGIVDTNFRRHVISGSAPEEVAKIRWIQSPENIAEGVVRSLARRTARIYIPWYGRIFAAIDFVAPQLMDAYIARKWALAADASPSTCPPESRSPRANAATDIQA